MISIRKLDNKIIAWVKITAFLLALVPLAKLGIGAYFDNLGANPIEKNNPNNRLLDAYFFIYLVNNYTVAAHLRMELADAFAAHVGLISVLFCQSSFFDLPGAGSIFRLGKYR